MTENKVTLSHIVPMMFRAILNGVKLGLVVARILYRARKTANGIGGADKSVFLNKSLKIHDEHERLRRLL
jgi:hypothetical protein